MPLLSETITVDDVTTEYSLTGDTGPVIVLISGFRIALPSWDKLYPEISSAGRVLAYNRCGIGKTSKATRPQTGGEAVRYLRKLLSDLNLEPPYILVGYSLGGIFVNLYARLKPAEVSAIVFLEAAHPDEKVLQAEHKPPFVVRFLNGALKVIDKQFDQYQHSEDECIEETISQINSFETFPSIPVTFVTGKRKMAFVPEKSFSDHLQCQQKFFSLSPLSKQVIAANIGHFPQITEPELVVKTVKEVAECV